MWLVVLRYDVNVGDATMHNVILSFNVIKSRSLTNPKHQDWQVTILLTVCSVGF